MPHRYDTNDSYRYSTNSPPPPTPDPYREARRDPEMDRLPMQFITPALVTRVTQMIPRLVTTRSWKVQKRIPSMVMQWAVAQPRTAILLWMCGEVDSWPKAATIYQLEDKKLPYQEKDLINIVENPALVVEVQWKVAMRPLPRGGEHVEFQTHNTVPLRVEEEIGPRTSSMTKKRNKVKFLDGSDTKYYVRKRLEINVNRGQDKAVMLDQIKQFHTLDHKNIAKIVSSYAQGLVVAFITPCMDTNLEVYLDAMSGSSESEKVLNWVTDLSSALAYIHAQKMEHKNIRPQKILIDSQDRIYFSVFGVTLPVRTSYAHVHERYSNDPSYIYAAPEVVYEDSKVRHQLADIFSLGCVFFEMVGKAKGRDVDELRALYSAVTHDKSFHMNLERVLVMTEQLKGVKLNMSVSRRTKVVEGSKKVLDVIKPMLSEDPTQRPRMKAVLGYLTEQRSFVRTAVDRRRNSVDVARPNRIDLLPNQSAVWGELSSLQPFYASNAQVGEGNGYDSGQTTSGYPNGHYDRERENGRYWDEQS
jgi:serine/threonine protein kinase